ncbi:hypothetical protein ACPCHW_26140, partial [Pseudomonas siliginis]
MAINLEDKKAIDAEVNEA